MNTKREVVTLHFGQAGIQIGNAIWETIITEHGILYNGTKDAHNDLSGKEENFVNTLFHHTPSDQYVPRSLIVDTEPTVVDEIRSGYYRDLFHPDLLISSVEDAGNNFARGYYALGKRMLNNLLEKVRYMVEACENFKGFMSYSGSGGGTGSGLYSLFIERVMLEYCGKLCIGSLVLSGKTLCDSVVEPYNSILRISQSYQATDLNILLDNESLYKICYEKLETFKPTFTDINRLLAPIFSSITAPFRFRGPMSGDLNDIATNLVPYPKVSFPSLSYAPFLSPLTSDHTLLTSYSLTKDVFEHDYSLLNLDIKKHKIMSSYLIYRGDHRKSSITKVLELMKKEDVFKWVDWCPTGFKVSQSAFPPINLSQVQITKSILMLCNHSGIIYHLEQISKKFRMLFRKRSFIHWYIGEGMEYEELENSQNAVVLMRSLYAEVCQIENTGQDGCDTLQNEVCQDLSGKYSGSVGEQKSMSGFEEVKAKRSKESADLSKTHSSQKKVEIAQNPPKLIKPNQAGETPSEERDLTDIKNTEVIIDSMSDPILMPLETKFRVSNEFVFSDKAKEILLDNISCLSPDMKQRMLGFTNID